MAYTPLNARVDELPQVIAGPILRRTQHDQVSVWLATRTNIGPVRLEVYLNGSTVATSPSTSLMQFGKNLYIIVVTASPQAGISLTSGKIYTYDIFFDNNKTLNSVGILDALGTGIATITYLNTGINLPSFSLPPDHIENVRLVHTSCRKPHGGNYDALPAVSNMIGDSIKQANGRPHQLFFTGDQIYADDVSSAMLAMISDVKDTFIGSWSEFGSLPDNTYLFGTPTVTDRRIANRFRFVNSIKLTAGIDEFTEFKETGDNHLLGLGEYIAMYLLVWSDVLWPTDQGDLPDFDSIFGPLDIGSTEEVLEPVESTDFTKNVATGNITLPEIVVKPTKQYIKYIEDTDKIWMFHQGLADVRRALANVPVYMMWDDHDITDDWFFSYDWTQKVFGITDQTSQNNNPYGRLVIQNGMTAFNIFQGWGNVPERYFDFTEGKFLLLAASKVLASATEWQVPQNWLDIASWVLPEWGTATTFKGEPGTGLTSPIKYDFTMQCGQYTVLMLDTRSNRFFQNTSNTDATLGRERPILIREEHLTNVLNETTVLYEDPNKNNQVLLVISPAPVIGHNIIDIQINAFRSLFDKNAVIHERDLIPAALRKLNEKYPDPQTLRDGLDLWFDSEAWSGNPLGLQTILQELAKLIRVVVLSGDVHFSYSSVLNYWRSELRTGVIAQLTASAAKNSSKKPGESIIEFHSNLPIIGSALIAPRIWVGWNSTTTADGNPHEVWAADTKGVILDYPKLPTNYHVHQVLSKPAVLCTNPILGSETYKLNRNDPPDWSYKYYFCDDSDDSRLAVSRSDYPEPLDPTLSHWERLATEHVILHHEAKRPVVVNPDNIAEITFGWLDEDKLNLAVWQSFWYAIVNNEIVPDPNEPLTFKPYTLHVLDMTQPDAYNRPEKYFN